MDCGLLDPDPDCFFFFNICDIYSEVEREKNLNRMSQNK